MRPKLIFLLAAFLLAGNAAVARSGSDSTSWYRDIPIADYSNPKRYVVDGISVHGVKYLDPATLAAAAGLSVGDTVFVPGNYVTQAINNLMSRRYFSNAEVVARTEGDRINFEIFLQERPRVYTWEFEGLRKGEITDLKDKLRLRPGGELSDYIIDKHIQYIRNFLTEKGFRNAEVEVRIENDELYQNAVNVTYIVDRGPKVRIGEIVFEGNEVFPDKRLRRTFKKTHRRSINILQNSKLKEDEYEEDKLKLIDFYNSRGYRNASIVRDSIYDINDKRIGIVVEVDEGNKYYFRNITWVGNSKYDTEFLQRMLGIESGDTYDRRTLYKRLGIGAEGNPDDMSVTSLYQNDGYLFSRIDPAEIIVGPDSLDLEIRIFEGRQATINNVVITGNTRVDDEVIRRELYTRPGELYDRSLLMSTMRQLMQMQHFNPEAIFPGINPVSAELVDISWNLQETSSDNFEVSGGWGAGTFVFAVGVNITNLSLKRFFKRGEWTPYPHGQNQKLSLRAQTNGTWYKGFSLSFTEPWLGGNKPVSLTVGAYYSDETNASYFVQKSNQHFRTIGVSAGLGRRLSWPDPYFTLYNEVLYQAYNLKDWDNFIVQNGTANTIAFRTVFSRNSIDQPIYPRRGSEFSVSLTLTPPYSLFDNRNYGDPTMSDNARYGWIEYHKWILKGQWFTTLSRNNNLVLMARAEMGYLGSYNRNKPSPFEGFDVGGSGLSGYSVYGVDVVGLRGYGEGKVTPSTVSGDYARVYNKYTLEMRYPVILQPATQIYGLVFAEGGNGFANWKSFNPFEIKRALGVGLRVNIQIIGMIGVDWGWGFDKPTGSNRRSGSKFGFVFGQQF